MKPVIQSLLLSLLILNSRALLPMDSAAAAAAADETQALLTSSREKLLWAVSTRQGRRATQEDAYTATSPFHDDNSAFFAVYDGHRGIQAAPCAAQKLPVYFGRFLAEDGNVLASLIEAFRKTDEKIPTCEGTTATVAFIHDDITLAHVGDSRAIVIRDGKVIFATQDHKPDNEAEKARIESVGAKIIRLWCTARIGSLAISRSLGDHDIKSSQAFGMNANAIIAIPALSSVPLTERDIVVMASDGLWGKLSNEEVAELVAQPAAKKPSHPEPSEREQASDNGNDETLKEIAHHLRDSAYERGSLDNITIMLVKLALAQEKGGLRQKLTAKLRSFSH